MLIGLEIEAAAGRQIRADSTVERQLAAPPCTRLRAGWNNRGSTRLCDAFPFFGRQ